MMAQRERKLLGAGCIKIEATQPKSDKFTPDILTLRLITTLILGPQLDNAK